MEFTVGGNECFSFMNWQIELIENCTTAKDFQADMERRAIFSIEKPIYKYLTKNMFQLKKDLKSVGIEKYPADLDKFSEIIGSLDTIGFYKTDLSAGLELECNSQKFHTVPPHMLTIARTFFRNEKKSVDVRYEEDYVIQRIKWIFDEKIKGSISRLHFAWDEKLGEKDIDIPIDDEEFFLLVQAQDEYKKI